jgi:glycosyltransferase 2 family protein
MERERMVVTKVQKRWPRLLLLGLGLAFTAWLILRIGPEQIAGGLRRVGPSILWLFLAYSVATAIGALPFRLLLAGRARPGIGSTIAGRFAASGANVIVPLFGMGGEPVRLLWLAPRDRPRGIAAIVVDRLSYCASGALFSLAGVAALLHIGTLSRSYAVLAAAVALGTAFGAMVLVWLTARHSLAGRAADLIHRLVGKKLGETGLGGSAREVDRHLLELLRGPRSTIVQCVLVHLVGRIAMGAEFYAGLVALGGGWDPARALVLATVPILVSPFASWIPLQVGVQEGTTAAAAAALGLDPAIGVTLVLLQRIRQVVMVSAAGLLTSGARAPAPEEDAIPTVVAVPPPRS